jgi:GAF domain-containing protein/CHASE1-domain containing sensor protein
VPSAVSSQRRTWPRAAAAIVAVLVIGLGATYVTARTAADDADERQEQLADQTANLTVATVQQFVAGISGVSGLPDMQGEVDRAGFDAFAEGAVRESPFDRLAFVQVVPAAERASFEAALGRPITDEPAGAPAPAGPDYLVVRWVSPNVGPPAQLVGWNLGADPLRRAAAEQARDEGGPVITETVRSQPTGQPAVFVVHPVFRPGLAADASVAERRRAVVGYVSTSVIGETLLAAVTGEIEDPPAVRIEDPGAVAAGSPALAESDEPPRGGIAVDRTVGGRSWRITVDDPRPVPTTGPGWLLAATLALASALALLGFRASRHERDAARHSAMVDRLAALGRSFAGAESVEDVRHLVPAEVPDVLEAEAAHLRLPGRAEPRTQPGDDRVVVRRRIEAAGIPRASLEVVWPRNRALDDLAFASLATVGEMCGQALARAHLIDSAKGDALRNRLLAGLAGAAATAPTTDHVVRTLVERAAEAPDATTAHLALLTDDGKALAVVHEGLDPLRSGATGVAGRPEVHPVEHPWPLFDAFRRNAPVLLGDLDAVAERFPEVVNGMRTSGLAAVACLPLADGSGRPFGALGFAWSTPQRFDDATVRMLDLTADLCAASLDRARATDAAQARSSDMATLAAHLSAARSFDEVGMVIVEHARPALGADFALLGTIDGDRFRLLAPRGPHLDEPAPYTDVDVNGDFPALIAVRRRRLVTFTAPDQVPDPAMAADLEALGLRAGACAPLFGADGEVTGTVIVLWSHAPVFDDALRARISTVADLCAQSVERSRLFDDEHRVRRDLQRTVLPAAAEVSGLDVATRYRPAARSLGMGGDWYDTLALEDGSLCVVIGDVGGHGVGAVAEMTQLRTVVHTLVAGGMELSDVLLRTSELIQRDGLGYATVLIAVVDPGAGSLDYVTAGHPPVLVRRPGGMVDTLTGGRHSVLGIELVPRPPGVVPFPPGSTLVAYTDGLIEQRDEDIGTSIRELADTIRNAGPLDADTLADRLLAGRPTTNAPLDDVALVVVRRTS